MINSDPFGNLSARTGFNCYRIKFKIVGAIHAEETFVTRQLTAGVFDRSLIRGQKLHQFVTRYGTAAASRIALSFVRFADAIGIDSGRDRSTSQGRLLGANLTLLTRKRTSVCFDRSHTKVLCLQEGFVLFCRRSDRFGLFAFCDHLSSSPDALFFPLPNKLISVDSSIRDRPGHVQQQEQYLARWRGDSLLPCLSSVAIARW